MNERRKAAIDALRGISSGETDKNERKMYMEAIRILIGAGNEDTGPDSFQCSRCIKSKVVEGENVCLAGCLTAAQCKKKFRPKGSERKERKYNARNDDTGQ